MFLFVDNRTEVNLDDLGLTFRDLGIDMNEIIEYATYVDPIVPIHDVPKFPIPKESHFNFLKPGSKEVLTRPVHIHEHLPPLNPPEDEPPAYTNGEKEIDVVGVPSDDNVLFKRPHDGSLDNPSKKIKTEDEGRLGRETREITSVMMTSSGFISPAREGKMPESKPPNLPPEFPKPIAPPMISPPFKPKDSSLVSQTANIDKKLDKKLKKKTHDKEKRKEKPGKEKHSLSADFPDSFQGVPPPPTMMPREANEHMIEAERKKALKKLKMKNKAELGLPRKKKEKPPKPPKQGMFDHGFLEKAKFDPFPVIPPTLPPSQIQAHNFLTGAHSIFPNSMLDTLGSNPLVDGKLVTEPDKNKLNIFKKISKPKDDPIKSSPMMPSQMDFLSPPKFDRYDLSQPSTSHQIYNDPMKKAHKLPKETTMTRVDESNVPINFSMSKGSESSFEELALPKTPTIPKTPDIKHSQAGEKKEKKERKKKERKVNAPDWNQPMQNLFMPDLTGQNNSFLQSLQNAGSFMNNLGNFPSQNPFSLPQQDMFQSSPGLLQRSHFGMGQLGQMNQMIQNPYGFPLPGMDMNMLQQQQQPKPKPKKVKPPKPVMFRDDNYALMQGSKYSNMASILPQSLNKRYDAPKLMNVEPFPLQHHQQSLSSFDQLLKDPHHLQEPAKKVAEQKMETFDLTSSPEPMTPAPAPQELTPTLLETIPAIKVEQHQPSLKEKTKEKKKKKDKDKEEKKKVSFRLSFNLISRSLNFHFRRKKRRKRKSIRKRTELQCQRLTVKALVTLKTHVTICQQLHRCRN